MSQPDRLASPRFETADMSPRGVAGVLGGFALLVVVAVTAIFYWLHTLSEHDRTSQARLTPQQQASLPPPVPSLQAHPVEDLHALQAREHALLASYAWVDAAHTRARIPIGRAMDLVVGRTLEPAQSPPP